MSSEDTKAPKPSTAQARADDAPATPTASAAPDSVPFRPGFIVWGRPPAVTFKAGPLPRDEGMARLMAMPPYPQPAATGKPTVTGSTADGLAGMALVGAPQPTPTPAQPAAPKARPASVHTNPTLVGSLVPGAGRIAPPKPLTPPAPAQPVQTDHAAEAEVVGAVVAEPIGVVPHAMADVSPVERPLATKSAKRAIPWGVWLVVGLGALAAGGAALWFSQRAPTAPTQAESAISAPLSNPAPATATTASPAEPMSVPASVTGDEIPQAARPAATPIVAAPAAATASPRAASPAPLAARSSRPPAAQDGPILYDGEGAVAAPVSEPSPPPVAAAPAQNDPNVPIVTRPQRLD